jgi:hypothetical protein
VAFLGSEKILTAEAAAEHLKRLSIWYDVLFCILSKCLFTYFDISAGELSSNAAELKA